MKALLFPALAAFFVFSAAAGDAKRTLERTEADVPARIAQLRAEIAALDAQARGNSPEFEAELREWEGKMAEPPEWSVKPEAVRAVPAKIKTILAIEPSERDPAQRAALVQYFRPQSKVAATARRIAAAKRTELAALRRAVR